MLHASPITECPRAYISRGNRSPNRKVMIIKRNRMDIDFVIRLFRVFFNFPALHALYHFRWVNTWPDRRMENRYPSILCGIMKASFPVTSQGGVIPKTSRRKPIPAIKIIQSSHFNRVWRIFFLRTVICVWFRILHKILKSKSAILSLYDILIALSGIFRILILPSGHRLNSGS